MKLKRAVAMFLTLVMALALAVPAAAAKPVKNSSSSGPVTVYLKGATTDTGSYGPEVWTTWQNVHYVGGAEGESPALDAWHLVYAGKGNINATERVHLTFVTPDDKEVVWEWKPEMGFSTNAGGNNPGWMIVAPGGWTLISGKNQSKSYIVAGGAAGQFNISGYHEGVSQEPDEPDPIDATLNIQKFIQSGGEKVKPVYEMFQFQILDGDNILITVTTDTNGAASAVATVIPGRTYTIHEVFEGEFGYQGDRYETPKDMTVTIPADAEEGYTVDVEFVNVPISGGETSAVFQLYKYLNDVGTPGDGFVFDIFAADGTKVGSMTSEDGIAKTEDFWVKPGDYIIREQLPTDEEYEYEPVEDIKVIVNDNGSIEWADPDFEGTITNIQKGKLNLTAGPVVQEHIEQKHEVEYKWYGEDIEGGTVVSYIGDFEDSSIVKDTGTAKNGFTYLIIDKNALANSENGLTVQIADSSKENKLAPAMKDTHKAPTYTIKINNDNKLVVTSDLGAFVAHVSPDVPQKFNPGAHYNNDTHPVLDIPESKTSLTMV